MKKLVIILSVLFTIISAKAQYLDGAIYNPNPNIYTYPSLREAIDMPLNVGMKIYVSQKGIGGLFNVVPKLGMIEDSVLIWDKHNGTVLSRDTTAYLGIKASWAGLVNDGQTDNYKAFIRLSKFVMSRGGNLKVDFDPGVYDIDTFRIDPLVTAKVYGYNIDTVYDSSRSIIRLDTLGVDSANVHLDTLSNNITNIDLSRVKNVEYNGHGAKINVRGNFKRKTTSTANGGWWKISAYNEICPLSFTECDNVTLRNFEIDGNVDQMTVDTGYNIEGLDYGVMFRSCTNVTVENLYVHHFATDGLLADISPTRINGKNISCRNFTFSNVRSLYNGRQAFTIGNLFGATFTDCYFNSTGDSLGLYPGHAPRKGLDIEPVKYYPLTIDYPTSNIHFNNCHFDDNVGGAIAMAIPGTISDIYFDGGTMDNLKHNYQYHIIAGVNNLSVKNMVINTGAGAIYPIWGNLGYYQGSTWEHNKITSSGSGIIASGMNAQYGVTFDRNELIGVGHDTSFSSYFPYISSNVKFTNNDITIDSGMYNPKHSNLAILNYCLDVSNNKWNTDLDTTGGKKFSVSYVGSRNVRGEYYPVKPSVRPYGAANWDFSDKPLFGTNETSLGGTIVRDNNGVPMVDMISLGNGAPTSGKFNKGDWVRMKDPAAATYALYVCTVGGTAGIDAQFSPVGPVSSGSAGAFKTGFVTDISSNRYVGESYKLQNDLYRSISSVSYPDSAVYQTGFNVDTGAILFKIPTPISSSPAFRVEGSITMALKGSINFTISGAMLVINTFYNPMLNLSGDSALQGTKIRLLRDASNALYISFFDTTTTFVNRTTIQFTRYTIDGTLDATDIANAAKVWSTKLVKSYAGYTLLNTLVNTSGGNYNNLINKPTFATVATTGAYNDLTGRPTLISTTTSTGVSGPAVISGTNINIPRYDLSSGLNTYGENRNIETALGSQIQAENFAPDRITVSQPLVSGVNRYTAIWLRKDSVLTGVKWLQTIAGSYTANNFNGVALYTYSGGVLTQVATSANDGTIWQTAATGAIGSKAFTSPYTASAGLYYVGFLYSASAATTVPSLGGPTNLFTAGAATMDFTNSGKTFGQATGQTTLPSTVNMNTIAGVTTNYYIAVY